MKICLARPETVDPDVRVYRLLAPECVRYKQVVVLGCA